MHNECVREIQVGEVSKIRFIDWYTGSTLYANVTVSPINGNENITIRFGDIVEVNDDYLVDYELGEFSLELLSKEDKEAMISRFKNFREDK